MRSKNIKKLLPDFLCCKHLHLRLIKVCVLSLKSQLPILLHKTKLLLCAQLQKEDSVHTIEHLISNCPSSDSIVSITAPWGLSANHGCSVLMQSPTGLICNACLCTNACNGTHDSSINCSGNLFFLQTVRRSSRKNEHLSTICITSFSGGGSSQHLATVLAMDAVIRFLCSANHKTSPDCCPVLASKPHATASPMIHTMISIQCQLGEHHSLV